jgi:mono/diheme cytochrome c family protein
MKRYAPALTWLALTIAMAGCGNTAPKGDAQRGAKLHEICLDCHGSGPYTRQDHKMKSHDALRREVVRWGDYYNPALSEQDVDDLVAYLERDFYKF